ncbi:MAG TPA: ATP-binding cassette domain-containing protein [Candidatus Saccharimonadia bacterium]|nr:ATP-binding cassette domain-containing protein [Candidatus Saccharimonadia bacterium]
MQSLGRFFYQRMRAHLRLMIAAMLLSLASGIIAGGVVPVYIGRFVAQINTPAASVTGAWLSGIVAAAAVCSLAATYLRQRIGRSVEWVIKDDAAKVLARAAPVASRNQGLLLVAAQTNYAEAYTELCPHLLTWLPALVATLLGVVISAAAQGSALIGLFFLVMAVLGSVVMYGRFRPFLARRLTYLEAKERERRARVELVTQHELTHLRPMLMARQTEANREASEAHRAMHRSSFRRMREGHLYKFCLSGGSTIIICYGASWLGISLTTATAVLVIIGGLAIAEMLAGVYMAIEAVMACQAAAAGLTSQMTQLRLLPVSVEPVVVTPGQPRLVTRELVVMRRDPSDPKRISWINSYPDLSLPPGMYAVQAELGGGKSTLRQCLTGAYEGSGQILIDGRPVLEAVAANRVVVMPQEVKWSSTVLLINCFADGADQVVNEAVMIRLLTLLLPHDEPKELLNKPCSDFSGGQERLLHLVLTTYWAIVHQAAVIPIDEPTNSLSRQAWNRVIRFLEAELWQLAIEYWPKRALPVILILTHDEPIIANIEHRWGPAICFGATAAEPASLRMVR